MYEQGDPAIGTAAVGQTVADDASAAYTNPAAMTALERSEVLMGSQLLVMNSEFSTNSGVQNPFVGSDGGNAGPILPGGGFYLAQKLFKGRAAAGFAFNAPAGLGLNYESGWKGRYLVQNNAIVVTNINPSLGFKLTDWLHVGAGVSVYYCYLRQEMAIFNPPAVNLLPLQVTPNSDGTASMKMDDWAVGYNLGLLLTPKKGTRLGLAYRSQAKFDLKGKRTVSGLGDYLNTLDPRADVSSRMKLPRSISVSVSQAMTERLEMLFDVGWQNWSAMKDTTIEAPNGNVTINRDWTDTYRLGIGTHYRLLKRLLVKAGFSYDSDPSSLANRTPDMPMTQVWRWGTGFDFDLNRDMVVSLNWEFVGMSGAAMNKDIQPIVVDAGGRINPRQIFPGREFEGSYNQYINMIGVCFRWKFGQGAEEPIISLSKTG